MKADLTRSTDRPGQRYRAVRMQQGRVQLDAEWNEQQDILNRRVETETVDTLGHSAVPLANPGFKLTGNGKNIDVSAGRCYVDGLLCDNPAALTVLTQPYLQANVSPVLPAGASLLALPPPDAPALSEIKVYDNTGAAVAPPDGLYIGHLEAWLRHVTALEDPLIREVALGVPDTSTRDQLVWQIKLLRAGDIGGSLTCLTVEPWASFTQPPDGKLAARAEPSTPPKDPCLLTPEAGYRRLENQLYRVEIHDDGSASGKVRYKWSRDNGSIVTRVTRWLGEPTANELEVASIGRDAYLAITAGCWLEFFDDTHELLGQPGVLVQVLKTEGNVVTVDLATTTGPLDKALYSENPRVRRWESWAQMAPAVAASATGWVELEDGIEVKFIPGSYRIGDYWTIPARTATADIEWPQESGKPAFAAPHGVLRAFTRLAVLSCQAGVWTTLFDCRNLFPALTELTNLYYVGGDGQEAMPNLLAPAIVALASPLEVAVFNGQFPVAGAQVRFTASDGALANGALVQVVDTLADGVAEVEWRIEPAVGNQTCVAELLEAGQPLAGTYNRIHFSASVSVAAQVAYDPAKCATLTSLGVTNVQDAIDALCKQSHGGGCCVAVGKGGAFEHLDKAILELIKRGERDICICLLPGMHTLSDSIDLQAPEGINLSIHGAGIASRLVLRQQEFNLFEFASVSFADFDVQWITDGSGATLRIEGCKQTHLRRLRLSGFPPPGIGLLQITGAAGIELTGCRVSGYHPETLIARIKQMLTAVPLLASMDRALAMGKAEIFAPIERGVVNVFAGFDAPTRKAFATQIEAALGAPGAQLDLSEEERAALVQVRADVLQREGDRMLSLSLDQWRTALLSKATDSAMSLGDARAVTLLADNRFDGWLSLYGETRDAVALTGAQRKSLNAALFAGGITLVGGPGDLRLRNNRLRGVRLGDEFMKRLVALVAAGNGQLVGCYRSVVADANTLVGETTDLVALDLGLISNAMQPAGDVGTTIATQGKYIGNFAHNDFRLFIVGHNAEAFGNGALNIVLG